MWRDPLDELIADLERIVPPTRAPKCDIPGKFFEMVAQIERESALERQQERRALQEGSEPEAPPSTIATAPAVWPVRPARRRDPSAPWDYAADTPDTDADDSGG